MGFKPGWNPIINLLQCLKLLLMLSVRFSKSWYLPNNCYCIIYPYTQLILSLYVLLLDKLWCISISGLNKTEPFPAFSSGYICLPLLNWDWMQLNGEKMKAGRAAKTSSAEHSWAGPHSRFTIQDFLLKSQISQVKDIKLVNI